MRTSEQAGSQDGGQGVSQTKWRGHASCRGTRRQGKRGLTKDREALTEVCPRSIGKRCGQERGNLRHEHIVAMGNTRGAWARTEWRKRPFFHGTPWEQGKRWLTDDGEAVTAVCPRSSHRRTGQKLGTIHHEQKKTAPCRGREPQPLPVAVPSNMRSVGYTEWRGQAVTKVCPNSTQW